MCFVCDSSREICNEQGFSVWAILQHMLAHLGRVIMSKYFLPSARKIEILKDFSLFTPVHLCM